MRKLYSAFCAALTFTLAAHTANTVGAHDLKAIYGGQKDAYNVEMFTFAVEPTHQDFAVGGQIYGTDRTIVAILFYLSNQRQQVDWYFEIEAYAAIVGVTFHPSKGKSMVYGVGQREGTYQAYELFQVSNQSPYRVNEVKSLRWDMPLTDFMGFLPHSSASPISFFFVTYQAIGYLEEPTNGYAKDYFLYSDLRFNGAMDQTSSGIFLTQLDTTAIYISRFVKSTSSGSTGLSYALSIGFEYFPDAGSQSDIPKSSIGALTESSTDYTTSCVSYLFEEQTYRTAVIYTSYDESIGALDSKILILDGIETAIAGIKMTSATTSMIVVEYALKNAEEDLTGEIQLQLLTFNFADLSYTKNDSNQLYKPTMQILVRWLGNDIYFSSLFDMTNLSGRVAQLYSGVDSERTTQMWGATSEAFTVEAYSEVAQVADVETYEELLSYHDLIGYTYAHKGLRSLNYGLYTFNSDVKLPFALQINMPPYVVGSTSIATVKSKIDSKISTILPLVRDDDANDQFNMEARMRDNRKLFFSFKPSREYEGQYELHSQTLTVDNVSLGSHVVDVWFLDKVSGYVGVELSFDVEVLSLSDYLRAGLHLEGLTFTGDYGCASRAKPTTDEVDSEKEGFAWGSEAETENEEGNKVSKGDDEEETEEDSSVVTAPTVENKTTEPVQAEAVESEVVEVSTEATQVKVDVSYDQILQAYMADQQTVENYLQLYGGPVTSKTPKMDHYGKLTFSFSRPVIFPAELLKDFDSSFKEEVPVLKPTEEDLKQIKTLYDRAYAIAEAKALAELNKNNINTGQTKSSASETITIDFSASGKDSSENISTKDLQECLAREDEEIEEIEELEEELLGMDPSTLSIEEIIAYKESGALNLSSLDVQKLRDAGYTEEQLAAAGLVRRRQLESQENNSFDRQPQPDYDLYERLIIEFIPGDDASTNEAKAMQKLSFKIKKVSSEQLELAITFDSPKLFGAGGSEQFIVVRADFGDFEPGWDSKTELLRLQIPLQKSNDASIQAVMESLGSVGAASTAATSAALGVNILLSGAMSQVWGMINGLQIFVHFPLFNLRFPDFSLVIVEKLIQIASFDILPTDSFFELLSPPEEADPEEEDHPSNEINPGLLLIGYESSYTILNMGTLFVTLLVMISIPLFLFCTRSCKQKSRWLNRKHESLGPAVRGNMWIRFLMEAFLDIAISGTVNFYTLLAAEKLPFDNLFNILNSLTFLVLLPACLVFPFAILGFYLKNFAKWEDETFEARYGAVFEGLRKDNKSSLAYPFVFTLRRSILTIVCLVAQKYLFLQIFSQLLTSSIVIWYLMTYKPFEEPLALKLDIFNEVTVLAFVYSLLCFSDANLRINENPLPYDISFMAFLVGNMCTHLFFLIKASCINAKEKLKKIKCCSKKNAAAKYAQGGDGDQIKNEDQGSVKKQPELDVVMEESDEEEDDGDDQEVESSGESIKESGRIAAKVRQDFPASVLKDSVNDDCKIDLDKKPFNLNGKSQLLGKRHGEGVDTVRLRELAVNPCSSQEFVKQPESPYIERIRNDRGSLAVQDNSPPTVKAKSRALSVANVKLALRNGLRERTLSQKEGTSKAKKAPRQTKDFSLDAAQAVELTNLERSRLNLKQIDDTLLNDLEQL